MLIAFLGFPFLPLSLTVSLCVSLSVLWPRRKRVANTAHCPPGPSPAACPARQSFICFVFGALRCPQNENGNWFSRFLAVLDLALPAPAPAAAEAMATITTTSETTTLI